MKVFVTGASGFLGTSISAQLLAQGHEVSSFSRHYYRHLERMGVHQFIGDITRPEDLLKAMGGHESVIHTAALAGIWGRWSDYYRTNVMGTENILRTAQTLGVRSLVYTSTPSVVSAQGHIQGGDERLPLAEKHLCHYSETKALAEQLVIGANDLRGLATAALRPHLIWGPGDPHILPRLLKKARAGKLRRVGDGQNKVDVIYVENAARAHLLALEALNRSPGRSQVGGQAFFLGQERPVNLWEFIDKLLSIHNVQRGDKSIGLARARRLGALMEKIYQGLGLYDRDPPMTTFMAGQLGTDHYFSHQKAHDLLGNFSLITLEDGLNILRDYVARGGGENRPLPSSQSGATL